MNQRALLRFFEALIRPIRNRIMTLVARGILESIEDGKGIQLAKVSLLAGETREDLERIQNFGVTSNPPPNSEVLCFFIGGNREHGFLVEAAPRDQAGNRPSVNPGEAALYSSTPGHMIKMHVGGFIEIKNSSVDLIKSYDRLLDSLIAEPFVFNKAALIAEKALIATMKAP